MLKKLISAKKFFRDPHMLAMAKAIQKNRHKKLQALIEEAPNLNVRGEGEITILHWAAYMKNKHALKALQQAGIDTTLWDDQGETVAHLVTGADDPEYLQILLEGGLNPNLRDRYSTPLLFQAIKARNMPQLKLLIKHGADVNIRSESYGGRSAIFTASSINEYKGLLILFENGANPDLKNKSGDTFREYFKLWNEDILTQEALSGRNKVKEWLRQNHIDFAVE